MKIMRIMIAALFACALIAGSTLAADTETCCEKAKTAGKDCTHPCCVTAKKDGKTCEKCNPKKAEKPPEKK